MPIPGDLRIVVCDRDDERHDRGDEEEPGDTTRGVAEPDIGSVGDPPPER